VILLLHGTAASTHSWAPVARALSAHATVIVPDLPGHGFTSAWPGRAPSIPDVATALTALIASLELPAPSVIAGHSAGAALAVAMAQAAGAHAPVIVGFNPSLVPPPAAYTSFIAPWLGALMQSEPVLAIAARVARERVVIERLLESTGSALSEAQRAWYARLLRDPAHVAGALALMQGWDLNALLTSVGTFTSPATLVLGTRDRWIPAEPLAAVIAAHFPSADVRTWAGGHVLHEEMPLEATALLADRMADAASR
jgi:magnesium chelatase accessory protein